MAVPGDVSDVRSVGMGSDHGNRSFWGGFRRFWRRWPRKESVVTTFLAVFGLVLMVVGVFLWSVPAGCVAAGLGLLVLAVGAEVSKERDG